MDQDRLERQANEVDAMRAIFADDFELMKEDVAWKAVWMRQCPFFRIKLYPLEPSKSSGVVLKDDMFCYLCVKLTPTYPDDEPEVSVQPGAGLSDTALNQLASELNNRATELKGMEMVYDLAHYVREFLSDKRKSTIKASFYEEMVQRQKQHYLDDEKKLRQLEEEKRKEEEEQRRKEASELAKLIAQDITRKKELRKEERVRKKMEVTIGLLFQYKLVQTLKNDFSEQGLAIKSDETGALMKFERYLVETSVTSDVASAWMSDIDDEAPVLRPIGFDIVPGEQKSSLVLLYKHFDAMTLTEFVEQCPVHFDSTFALKLFAKVVECVDKLHLLGIFHGTLLPDCVLFQGENVVLRYSGYRFRLLRANQQKRDILNPIEFRLAPEVFQEDVDGVKLDIYGLGLVLEILFRVNVPHSLHALLSMLLADDPKRRPSLSDVREQLSDISKSSFVLESKSSYKDTFLVGSPLSRRLLSDTISKPASRYESDFIELEFLGAGSFGHVVKAQNRLDGRFYAIKKIPLHRKDYEYNKKMIREVTTLSRLHHMYIARYYHAWVEKASKKGLSIEEDFSTEEGFTEDWLNNQSLSSERSNSREDEESSEEETDFLYIQMEFCEKKTLKDAIEEGLTDKDVWRILRQILEGLAHIHMYMIHRDLKPSNIFVDKNGDIKIGDFGLALRLDEFHSNTSGSGRKSQEGSELTRDVGTYLYIAPEVLKPGTKYNQKVDMYSLGIILFECLYRFSTQFERIQVIKNLRDEKIVFPPDFKKLTANGGKLELQGKIIHLLLQHEADKRPSSEELLRSDLLPAKIEHEVITEAMRTFVNPSAPYYSHLMASLFNQTGDRYKDFTYDFNVQLEMFSELVDRVKPVLKKHGGSEFSPPLLLPSSAINESKAGVVKLLDKEGVLVELPYDLTLPFARWIARKPQDYWRRYSIERVYRHNLAGGQPRTVLECDFDIIHSTPCLAYDAETVKIVFEIAEVLSLTSKPLIVMINHGSILDGILDHIDIAVSLRPKFCVLMCQFYNQRKHQASFKQLAHELFMLLKLSEEKIAQLESVLSQIKSCFDGGLTSVDEVSKVLPSGLLKTGKLKRGMEDIHTILGYLERLGISPDLIQFNPLYSYNYHYYRAGFMFQVSLAVSNEKTNGVIAAGGRFDSLVEVLKHPTTRDRSRLAVGVNIAIGKLFSLSEVPMRKSAYARQSEPPMNSVEVLVASYGSGILIEDRLGICARMWESNIAADYVVHDGIYQQEELHAYCKQHNIPWLVTIKDYVKRGLLKLKSIKDPKLEFELRIDELIDYLVSQPMQDTFIEITRKERTVSTSESVNSTQIEDELSRSMEIHQLSNKGTKGKQSKHSIRDKVARSVSPFLQRFTSGSSIDVLVLDLRMSALRKITASTLEDDSYKKEVISALSPNLKEQLMQARQFILDLKRKRGPSFKYLFLYSIPDDNWEIFKLLKLK